MLSKKITILVAISCFTLAGAFLFQKIRINTPPSKQIDLIGVGFPRAGTTAFFQQLENLPHTNYLYRIYDVEHKIKANEINFFGNLSAKSSVTLRATENHKKKVFKPPTKYYEYLLSDEKVNIEKSPQYIWKDSIHEQIFKFNPDVKIVINIRNPADWIWSYYKHCIDTKRYDLPESTTFESFLDHIQPESGLSMKECAIFSNFVKSLYDRFPRENIYVMALEDMYKIKTTSDLCDYLNLPNPSNHKAQTNFKNARSYRDEMGAELYDSLSNYYRPFNEQLFEIIGHRIETWDK